MVTTAGAFSGMHINYRFTSGFLTVITGSKVFITFAVTKENSKEMRKWHMKDLNWNDVLTLMGSLEGPQINCLTVGQTIYVLAGQLHMALSPRCSALLTFETANPLVQEWDNMLNGHHCVIDGFCKYLALTLQSQFCNGLEDLREGLRLWENVKGLLRKRDAKMVGQSKVDVMNRHAGFRC